MNKKVLVLGGGFAGTTVSKLLADEGMDITLIEKDEHLGGGCRTFFHGLGTSNIVEAVEKAIERKN